MAHYLDACGQDGKLAVELYRWNARISGAFWVDLGHLEVPLRNALDQRFIRRHEAKSRGADWFDDPSGELGRDRYGLGKHAQPYKDIATARARVIDNQKEPTHHQILSETSFGLWHQMVSKSQTFLWPDLAGAFAYAPDRRQETISSPVAKLRHFRNRIAHHHRIWAIDCESRQSDLLSVARFLDPELSKWIEQESHVGRLLAGRPS